MLESEVVESNNEVLASFLCVFALHSSEQTYLTSHLNGANGIMIRQTAHETTPVSTANALLEGLLHDIINV